MASLICCLYLDVAMYAVFKADVPSLCPPEIYYVLVAGIFSSQEKACQKKKKKGKNEADGEVKLDERKRGGLSIL